MAVPDTTDEESDQIEMNFQCGECGIIYNTHSETEKQITADHLDSNYLVSETCEKEEIVLKNSIREKEDIIIFIKLKEKNENLAKKITDSAKEIRRTNLALEQCMYEKSEMRKKLNSQSKAMN